MTIVLNFVSFLNWKFNRTKSFDFLSKLWNKLVLSV